MIAQLMHSSSPHHGRAPHVTPHENMSALPAYAANNRDIEVTATFDRIDTVHTTDSFATAHTIESTDTRKNGSTDKLSPTGVASDSLIERGDADPDAAYHSEEPVINEKDRAPPADGGQAELARTVTGGSARPYSAFPKRTKWLIAGLGGVAAVFSPISVSALLTPSSRPSPRPTCSREGVLECKLTGRATSSSPRFRRSRPPSTAANRTSRSPSQPTWSFKP